MIEYWQNKREMDRAVKRYMGDRNNRGLVWTMWGFIAAPIVLFAVMIIWFDSIPEQTMLLLRGCAGACAIVFAVLAAVVLYRAHSAHWIEKTKR